MDWEKLQPDVYRLLDKHFTPGRSGYKISYIVLHYNAGNLTVEGCWSVWQTRQASAHYQVESGGRIGQLVNDWDTGWHAGNWEANCKSIGIEHANIAGGYITETCLDAGAHLVAALCKYYGLGRPQWLVNVFPHSYFQATSCPGQIYGTQKEAYIQRAQYWYDVMTGAKQEEVQPTPAPTPSNKIPVNYQCYDTYHKWLREVDSVYDGSEDDYAGWIGYPITGLRAKTKGEAEDVGYLEYRMHVNGGDWFNWRRDYEIDSSGDTFAGNLKLNVDGLQMRLIGLPGKNVRYRVHTAGGSWLDWITGCGDGDANITANEYAGIWGKDIDAVQIEVV